MDTLNSSSNKSERESKDDAHTLQGIIKLYPSGVCKCGEGQVKCSKESKDDAHAAWLVKWRISELNSLTGEVKCVTKKHKLVIVCTSRSKVL